MAQSTEVSGADWVPEGTDEAAIAEFWRAVRGQVVARWGNDIVAQYPDTQVPPAWAFGDDPQLADDLLALILDGTKTGTASALWDYAEGESVPQAAELSIILDGAGQPRAIIRTTSVNIVPFNEVTEEHAFSEGEGDRTLETWRRDHRAFWGRSGLGGREFNETMPVVAERFELLYPA